MAVRAVVVAVVAMLAIPSAAFAQVVPEPPLPCPWWDCGQPDTRVVVEDYRIDTVIDGSVVTTRVTQVLRNDSDWVAEGEFIHPVPPGFTVTELVLWIDGEPVVGEVLDAGEARGTYEEIVRRVLDPALLEFVDDGLVRASVFPIEPGDRRTIEIEYTGVIQPNGDLTRFTHPLGREHASFGPVEALAATVQIELPALKTVYSPTHAISVDYIDATTAVVGYEATDIVPGGDFVLYASTSETQVGIDVITYRDSEGRGYFLLTASPGLATQDEVVDKDVVVVLDISGSMEGEKIRQAKIAADFVLDNLNEGDRFDVIAFSTGITSFANGMANQRRADDAADWVAGLSAGGSTDIAGALTEAFDRSDGRPLYVLFLTDGLPTQGIVDTSEIMDLLERQSSERISLFAFGVGYDVDTLLLDGLADEHHGSSAYVTPDERIDEQVSALYSKVGTPVLTNVQLDISGVTASDLYPRTIPDLFSGEPLVVAGRYDGPGAAVITLEGFAGDERYRLDNEVVFGERGGEDAVPRVWATRKIGALLRDIRLNGPNEETTHQIVQLSIEHGIVTPYTSYLVTEDLPFGADAVDDIAREAAATTTAAEASGEEAVSAADAAGFLSTSEIAAEPTEAQNAVVQIAGRRTFRLSEGVWTDTTFEPDGDAPIRIGFLSDDYFELAAVDPEIAAALSVGPRVIVVIGGLAYEVVAPEGATDNIEITEASTTIGSTTTATTATDVPVAIPPIESTDGDSPSGIFIAVTVAALVAAFGAAVALFGRK